MEEVDKIIIHNLKSVGCDIEDDVESLLQFNTELIVEATVKCLRVINGIELSASLPPSMSAKFRVGTSLAGALTDLGYRGEIGYQTFLYSNENDIRKVFMFLIEKLPKGSEETTDEVLGGSALLQRAIGSEIKKRLASPWVPPFCKKDGVSWRGSPSSWQREGCCSVQGFHASYLTSPRGVGDLTRKIPKDVRTYYKNEMKFISQQPLNHHDLAPSLIEENARSVTAQQDWENEWNSAGLASRLSPEEYKARKRQRLQKRIADSLRQGVQKSEASRSITPQDLASVMNAISDKTNQGARTKGSRFTHIEKLQFAQDEEKTAAQMGIGEGPRVDTEQEQLQKQGEELNQLKEDLADVSAKFEAMELDVKKFTAGTQQMQEQFGVVKRSNEEKEESYRVKKRTLDLLPDAENNIAKLQGLVETSSQRLVSLANQWEKHRAPLILQFRELKELNDNKMSETQKRLEDIKELREKMKELADDAREKEELQKQLVSEYERMTKDVNRSAYTRRIMEIVQNIKKQKAEIDKVLIDTRAIQKEINQLSGKLDRTFTVTDELIFRDAKKDESVRKAYKYLAALHENCNSLIKTVEETGSILREIRELEDQIENESNDKIFANLEKITSDYQQMKKENTAMLAKLKKS
ncbi:coiled-coil domain-containing protein 22 homolog [Lineus longissimus]|uniref:coiled-coil domain-containing protein 22 homolog n=1 Tax=Lineus longissimus TaxID=88925 RepID=UPI002B4EA918